MSSGSTAAVTARPSSARAPEPRRGFWVALATVVLLGAGLRFWALDYGLPHPRTRPDEEVVAERTALPARGEFDLKWGTYPSAYVYLVWAWGTLGLKAGQVLGALPPGDYASALRDHFDRIILVDRVLSALVGTAAVAVLIALCRPALGTCVALSAGVLLATNFLHARDSHAAKPDTLLALVILLALGAMVPLARAPSVARAALAGLVIGLAVAVKYPAVFLLGTAYLATYLGSSARGWRRLFPAPWFVTCAVAAATFAATSYDVLRNPDTLRQVVDLLGAMYPQVSPKVVYPLPPIPGYPMPMDEPWWGSLVYHARFSLRYGAGLLPTLLAPAAVIWGFASGRPLAVLTAATAVLYYIVMSASPVGMARYMTPLMPWLALLEAGLLGALVARIRDRRWAMAVLTLGTLALAAEPLASAVAHNRIIARTDTRVLATRWMAENLPSGAKVLVLGNQVWFWGQPQLPPGVQLKHAKPNREALKQAGIEYVLTHEHVLFSSHVDPAVMEQLAPGLTLLADFDPSTPGRDDAIFEARDAYYVPFHNFGGVILPGPRVRIYAFDGGRVP
jgi:hypothetical protein